MENWTDQGIVLAVRPHGENGAVVSLLTETHGRHLGYVYGARSQKTRGLLEIGTVIEATWQSRVADQLGNFTFEHGRNNAALMMDEPLKLAALMSACALCDVALPEREVHPGLFHGMGALMEALQTDIWGAAYILWEIAFLKEIALAFFCCFSFSDSICTTISLSSRKS